MIDEKVNAISFDLDAEAWVLSGSLEPYYHDIYIAHLLPRLQDNLLSSLTSLTSLSATESI
jgi:hypothetical protein